MAQVVMGVYRHEISGERCWVLDSRIDSMLLLDGSCKRDPLFLAHWKLVTQDPKEVAHLFKRAFPRYPRSLGIAPEEKLTLVGDHYEIDGMTAEMYLNSNKMGTGINETSPLGIYKDESSGELVLLYQLTEERSAFFVGLESGEDYILNRSTFFRQFTQVNKTFDTVEAKLYGWINQDVKDIYVRDNSIIVEIRAKGDTEYRCYEMAAVVERGWFQYNENAPMLHATYKNKGMGKVLILSDKDGQHAFRETGDYWFKVSEQEWFNTEWVRVVSEQEHTIDYKLLNRNTIIPKSERDSVEWSKCSTDFVILIKDSSVYAISTATIIKVSQIGAKAYPKKVNNSYSLIQQREFLKQQQRNKKLAIADTAPLLINKICDALPPSAVSQWESPDDVRETLLAIANKIF